MNINSGVSYSINDEDKIHDANWIPSGNNDIICLKSGEKGVTEVIVRNAAKDSEPYVAATIDAPISGLKLRALDDGSVVFAVAGLVDEEGHLFNDEAVEKKSTARVFDSYRVRSVSLVYRLTSRQP